MKFVGWVVSVLCVLCVVCVCVWLCVCVCSCECVIGCLCLVVLVVGTCGCLCGTLQGLVVSLWHFGWPWESILTRIGCSWESFRHFGETLGLHFGTLGLHLGTLGFHVGVLWALCCVALDPSSHFCGKCSKKAPKMDAKIKTFSMIFRVFVESGTAFGLRLCSRIRVRANFGPLVFTLWATIGAPCFFNVFLTCFGVPKKQYRKSLRQRRHPLYLT